MRVVRYAKKREENHERRAYAARNSRACFATANLARRRSVLSAQARAAVLVLAPFVGILRECKMRTSEGKGKIK